MQIEQTTYAADKAKNKTDKSLKTQTKQVIEDVNGKDKPQKTQTEQITYAIDRINNKTDENL